MQGQLSTDARGRHGAGRQWAVAALAALACGCQTTTERAHDDDANPLTGHWTGSNRFRPQIEVQIDNLNEDRTVKGTACWWETSGVIVGQRLDKIATGSETGLSIRFNIGRGAFHVQRRAERKALMWETRTRDDGTLTRPLRTRISRTTKPGCVQRYRAEAKTPAPVGENAQRPLARYWTGQWENGTVSEMAVVKGAAKGDIEATYCTKSTSGEIAIYDLRRRGPLKARLDAAKNTITFEERLRRRGKRRFSFRVEGPDEARLGITREKGRTAPSSTTLVMRRGASTQGCLAYIDTTPVPSAAAGVKGGDTSK